MCVLLFFFCFCCSVELNDETTQSYVRALRDSVQPGVTRIVLCVLPDGCKERYDAIKLLLSVSYPGDVKVFDCLLK